MGVVQILLFAAGVLCGGRYPWQHGATASGPSGRRDMWSTRTPTGIGLSLAGAVVTVRVFTCFIGLVLSMTVAASAQSNTTSQPRTATQAIQDMITGIEKQLTGVAREMPEDKYEFAPTEGAFRGVRNFAKQIKHAAAVHYLVAASILGEPITADMSGERGPDSVKTKTDVLKYLEDSFSYLKRAAATVDDKNAFTPIKGVFGSAPDTRMGLIVVAVSHSSNHYGQVVEYLRMNGLVPPSAQ
jgi:hypothetical protein